MTVIIRIQAVDLSLRFTEVDMLHLPVYHLETNTLFRISILPVCVELPPIESPRHFLDVKFRQLCIAEHAVLG